MRIRNIVFTGWVVLAAAACGGKGKGGGDTEAQDTRPLFDRLGGKPAIAKVVTAFVAKTGSDPRISAFFTNTDLPKLEAAMVEHICEITGGPCKYTGRTMIASHAGMGVKDEDFAAFMEDLEATLTEAGVPARETGEVLAAFNGLKPEVVNIPAAPAN